MRDYQLDNRHIKARHAAVPDSNPCFRLRVKRLERFKDRVSAVSRRFDQARHSRVGLDVVANAAPTRRSAFGTAACYPSSQQRGKERRGYGNA